jgi:hypothetical protein
MKTKNILFALMVIFTMSFIGCQKDNTTPSINITVTTYGNNDSIDAGVRLSSWNDGVWLKNYYHNGDTIFNQTVELPDTLIMGSWGNRLVVFFDGVIKIDTIFSNPTFDIIIPIN